MQLHAQSSGKEVVNAVRKQIRWLTFGAEPNPVNRWNPLRPFMNWYYRSILNAALGKALDERFETHNEAREKTDAKKGATETIVDLALAKYLENDTAAKSTNRMDSAFRKSAINQIKIFLLAGHDTTSSTICYAYHLLSKHPALLERMRQEHDEILGKDLEQASAIISDRPHTLNQLHFTTAVLKETMRLFPAASSVRDGDERVSLSENGKDYPTDGCIVWSLHQAIHRDIQYWPQADDFVPERWLVPPGDPLFPIKGAWRPFENGPRNCIGQEFAMMEMKVVLVMTVRRFTIDTVFEEWDVLNRKPGPQTVDGERAYQVLDGTNRGPDGFPSRVKLAETR